MLETLFLFFLAFAWIIFATVQDLRSREIANWLNFSLPIFALGARFFYSLFFAGNLYFFYQGLMGLVLFFILGNLFYYGKLFAGGDAKLFIGLGAILPFSTSFLPNLESFLTFIMLFLFAGAAYGIVASIFLCMKNYGRFRKEFAKQAKRNRTTIWLSLAASLAFIAFALYINSLFFILAIASFAFPFLYSYAKAVDEAAMVKTVDPSALRVGDWLYGDVKTGNRKIKAEWGGLTMHDIHLLKKAKKKVKISEGVAFTPVFFVSFAIFFYIWSRGLWYPFW